jgi:IS30 family transposase
MKHHLGPHERYQIEIGLTQGKSVAHIAGALERSPSTIYREIARNAGAAGYSARFAQQRADIRAKASRNARVIDAQTWQSVEHYLLKDFSPEQIADSQQVSHETIYRYIYRDKRRGGQLWLHLRCQKRYRKRCSGRDRRGQIPNQRRIDERPAHIEHRAQVGHWEADTVVGPHHASALLSIVERKSGYALIAKLADRTASSACAAMIKLLGPIAQRVKTVTTDNGSEFAHHERLDQAVGCNSYFCRPYASWQRGTNENLNGLIRQYVPKGRELSTLSQEEIDMIMHRLNHRPRKRLGFKTPHQVFIQSLHRVAIRR